MLAGLFAGLSGMTIWAEVVGQTASRKFTFSFEYSFQTTAKKFGWEKNASLFIHSLLYQKNSRQSVLLSITNAFSSSP